MSQIHPACEAPQRRRHFLMQAGASAAWGLLPATAAVRAAYAADPVAGDAGPPIARVEPVTELLFGQSVTDRYRWMENPADAEWLPFMTGQAAYARRALDAIPGRAALAARVAELSGGVEIVSAVQLAGPYVFLEKRPAGASSFGLYVRRGAKGKERLLVDPQARRQGDTAYAMSYWQPSPDGLHVAYGMSPAGSERAVIEIIETASARVLPERIDRAPYASPSWTADGRAFYFNRLSADAKEGSENYYKDSVCWLHRLGSDPAQDVQVMKRGQFAAVAAREIDFPFVLEQPGSRWAIACMLGGVQREQSLFVNTAAAARKGLGGWQPICTVTDKVVSFTLRGDDIWLLTEHEAPRGRIVHVKATAPAFAAAREVVPQGAGLIKNLFAARDAIYVQDMDGGVGRLRRFSGKGGGGKPSAMQLPFDGAISHVFADPQRDGAIALATGWVQPQQALRVAASGAVADTGWVAKPALDVSAYTSEETFATAQDGVRVPVSIVYRKGLARDGSAPALIEAYGSYAVSSDPYFAPRMLAWLERGGVWATAHVRGGGEYGREWHEAGRFLNKPNTWRDLIAASEHLVAQGWTRPARLAIRGGSAGGIAVGGALTERPDLFGAVVSNVGVSNALRSEFSQNGPPNIPEFGSVTTEAGFKGLFAMDAYQHVKDGERYPAVLLTTGMNDPRVDPWEAAKMTARLQAASSAGKPILLRVDFGAGHGIGSTRTQRDEEMADTFAFLFWQAGLAR